MVVTSEALNLVVLRKPSATTSRLTFRGRCLFKDWLLTTSYTR